MSYYDYRQGRYRSERERRDIHSRLLAIKRGPSKQEIHEDLAEAVRNTAKLQGDPDISDLHQAMRRLTKRRKPEEIIHRAIVQHLRTRGVPGLVWWHTPNGGKRNHVEAAKFKALGVRPGVADLVFVHNGKFYALELKAPEGNPTEAQMQFVSDINSASGFACIAVGLDQALKCLETWGLLIGEAA